MELSDLLNLLQESKKNGVIKNADVYGTRTISVPTSFEEDKTFKPMDFKRIRE